MKSSPTAIQRLVLREVRKTRREEQKRQRSRRVWKMVLEGARMHEVYK